MQKLAEKKFLVRRYGNSQLNNYDKCGLRCKIIIIFGPQSNKSGQPCSVAKAAEFEKVDKLSNFLGKFLSIELYRLCYMK